MSRNEKEINYEDILSCALNLTDKALIAAEDVHEHVVEAPTPMPEDDHYKTQLYIEMVLDQLNKLRTVINDAINDNEEEADEDGE